MGANGTGKTTIFHLITGEEDADGGEISYSKKTKIGYFSQNVGEMSGRSALSEVMSGTNDVVMLGRAKEENFIARFKARVSHASQVQSRIKKLEKIERIELPEYKRTIKFEFSEVPRSGDDVVFFEQMAKTWETQDQDPKTVFSDVSGLINRQDKIAVVGINGAGKSTFLKVLAQKTA